MNEKNKTTDSQIGKPKVTRKRKLLIIIGVILLALSGIFLALDIPARVSYAALNRDITKIATEIMTPAGAVSQGSIGNLKLAQSMGNGLIDSFACGTDLPCPTVAGSWVVPIAPGQEQEFASKIVSTLGYLLVNSSNQSCANAEYLSCYANGTKGKLQISIGINNADTTHHHIPNQNVSPRIWRSVTVRISY